MAFDSDNWNPIFMEKPRKRSFHCSATCGCGIVFGLGIASRFGVGSGNIYHFGLRFTLLGLLIGELEGGA